MSSVILPDTTTPNLAPLAEQRQYSYPQRTDSNESVTSDVQNFPHLEHVSKVFNTRKRSEGSTRSSSPPYHPSPQSQAPNNGSNTASTPIQRVLSPSPSLTPSLSSLAAGNDSDFGEGSADGTPRNPFRTTFGVRQTAFGGLSQDNYLRTRESFSGRIVLTTPKLCDPSSFDHLLVPTPSTYEQLLKIAVDKFQFNLGTRRPGDITLRCGIKRAGGSTIWAQLYSSDWQDVIKDGDEIGVFHKDNIPQQYDERPSRGDYQSSLSTDVHGSGTSTCPKSGTIPSVEVTRAADDGKDDESKDSFEKSFLSFTLNPSKGVTSIAEVPDTYEKCQAVARETFFGSNSFISSTSIVLKGQVDSSSGGKLWSIIHRSAYSRMVTQRTGRIDIRVEVEGEQATRANNNGKPCQRERAQQQQNQKEATQNSKETSAKPERSGSKQAPLRDIDIPPLPQLFNAAPYPTPNTPSGIPVDPIPFQASHDSRYAGYQNISHPLPPSTPQPNPIPASLNQHPQNAGYLMSPPPQTPSRIGSSTRSATPNHSFSSSSVTLVSPSPSTARRTSSVSRSNRGSTHTDGNSTSDSSSTTSPSDSGTTSASSSYDDDGSETSTATSARRSKEYLAPTKASMGKGKEKERDRSRERYREREKNREREKEPRLKKKRSDRSDRFSVR